ncbi:WG repeat-containing protein [Fulvivirga lutea]|uniref:WG repeat-containing protein n=1 Tax=Fulvivirga lutea TaxID=2810512 RepID=A0A974WEK1_9BACT|nr:WG repeat-containing protein [Fulvivirga lutea]QSE96913.1 WG repeat-containing protein [Fulvivirga lutea]
MNLIIRYILIVILIPSACKNYIEKETANFQYSNIKIEDSLQTLIAVSNEEFIEYGSDIAFVSLNGDTAIAFGDFAYFGTDTLQYYANVLYKEDSVLRPVGIDRYGSILFDVFLFDNGPDYYSEGLVRVERNGLVGYANEKGEIVIPCKYEYASSFQNGLAEVTFKSRFYLDGDEHKRVESDEWFKIDKSGKRLD